MRPGLTSTLQQEHNFKETTKPSALVIETTFSNTYKMAFMDHVYTKKSFIVQSNLQPFTICNIATSPPVVKTTPQIPAIPKNTALRKEEEAFCTDSCYKC
eukprot:c21712_g4_i1 orf=171-470(-)